MENKEVKQKKRSTLKRLLVQRIIAVAVLSIVFTVALFYVSFSTDLINTHSLFNKYTYNYYIPEFLDYCIIGFLAIILAIILYFLLLRKVMIQVHELDDAFEEDMKNWDFTLNDNILDASSEMEDEAKSVPEPVNEQGAKEQGLLEELKSEKLLNNLLFSLINQPTDDKEKTLPEIIDIIGNYCKCDYAAIYTKAGETHNYQNICAWDSEPDLARHSTKVALIDLNTYKWMHKTYKSEKPFVFRTSMLDSLMESVQGAAEDVKAWMRMQAQESSEHKLSKHEGWEYFIGFPFIEDGLITGMILLGYQKAGLPLSQDIIDRLANLSNALGKKITAVTEEGHSDSVEYLQAVLDNLSESVFVTDLDGKIIIANRAAHALNGSYQNQIQGKRWKDVFNLINSETRHAIPDPVNKIIIEFTGSYPFSQTSLISKDGRELQIEGIAAPVDNKKGETTGVVFILRNITQRILEENERCEMQKMEAISSLSSGFAHDFNNILTAILGNISLAMDDIPANSETASWLKAAEESTLRGKEITDNLLAMSKGSPVSDSSSDALKSLEQLINRQLAGTNIKPVYSFDPYLPEIKMTAAMFEKIIVNLVNNAVQAMPQGGILSVKVNVTDIQEINSMPLAPGKYVCIHLIDTGEGIAYENQNKVFVPYFSTRNGASGLGLPITYSLLKKHGGYIRLHSQPSKGTDCELYIPVIDVPMPEVKEIPVTFNRSAPFVLILDEDDSLGNLLVKTLVKMGIRVQKTVDPEELSTLFFKAMNNGSPVKLVLADLNMPVQEDIIKLLMIFKKSDPRIKLVAYSNQIRPNDLDDYKQRGFDDILIKPFNISDLRTVIKRNISV